MRIYHKQNNFDLTYRQELANLVRPAGSLCDCEGCRATRVQEAEVTLLPGNAEVSLVPGDDINEGLQVLSTKYTQESSNGITKFVRSC